MDDNKLSEAVEALRPPLVDAAKLSRAVDALRPPPYPAWLCPVWVRDGYTGDRARHSPHSRRPWECRACGARAADGKSWHFDSAGVQL